jgi:acetyl-CoA carboxylase biotin carboxylase subunit
MVTGVDLVQWQIRIARGEPLDLAPDALLSPRGHAIECRIYAEDPDNAFLPSPGRILCLHAPAGPGIRRDSGVEAGFEVPIFYDSMISKLVAWGETRDQSIARLLRALSEYEVRGIKTTIPFFQWILATGDFRAGRFDTTTLDVELAARVGRPFVEAPDAAEEVAAVATAIRSWFRAQTAAARAPAARGPSTRGWTDAARRDGLRQ